MTNEELKAAIKYVNDFATDVDDEGLDRDGNARHFFNVVKASSELLQLKEGTYPDMVMVPKHTVDRLKIAEKALSTIAVYDLFDCAAVEDTDFEAQGKMIYEIAATALKEMKASAQKGI